MILLRNVTDKFGQKRDTKRDGRTNKQADNQSTRQLSNLYKDNLLSVGLEYILFFLSKNYWTKERYELGVLENGVSIVFTIFPLRRLSTDLVSKDINDMQIMSENNIDCWLTRVNKIERNWNLSIIILNHTSNKFISNTLHSNFYVYWLNKINQVKSDNNINFGHITNLKEVSLFN